MNLLLDLFGFLTVLLRGLMLVAEALTVGGVSFLCFVAAPVLDADDPLRARMARLLRISAVALGTVTVGATIIDVGVLAETFSLSWRDAIGSDFVQVAGLLLAVAAIMAAMAQPRPGAAARVSLAVAAAFVIVAMAATTHAAARLENRALLFCVTALHQLGGALWIGGIPYFLLALAGGADARLRVARRFSQLCVFAVVLVAASAAANGVYYIGDMAGFYGTSYGAMTATKLVLFLSLLAFGGANFFAVRALGARPDLVLRLRRFAEVEVFTGLMVFFAAASLTSQPPAVDMTRNRVPFAEIVQRVLTPRMPQMTSPDHAELGVPMEQARLNALAAEARATAPQAYVPGGGFPPPSTAADIAWSEYNHNWSGVFVAVVGVLALLAHAGVRPARHWPLLFIALGLFVALRSDPEAWPLGDIGFFESMRAPEVVQHRLAAILVALIGVFEWRVRVGALAGTRAAYVFPIANIAGSLLLLTHSHALGNVEEALLTELSHTPLMLLGLIAGCARWLELRAPDPVRRIAALVWPVCFIGIGVALLLYRES